MIPLLCAFASAGDVLDDGLAVRAVLAAQSFTLAAPYAYEWSADHRSVATGTLLQLDVDPAWLRPRDASQPVLYVGDTPAERIGGDWRAGRVVVLVPGDVDPATEPIYFGGHELPERVAREDGRATLAIARARGFSPRPIPPAGARAFATREELVAWALAWTTGP